MYLFDYTYFSDNCRTFGQITELNLEISLFLNTLKAYSERVYQIDENTIKLLTDTITIADNLIGGADVVAANTNDSGGSDMLSDINGEYFQCERFITCCICHVSKMQKKKIDRVAVGTIKK